MNPFVIRLNLCMCGERNLNFKWMAPSWMGCEARQKGDFNLHSGTSGEVFVDILDNLFHQKALGCFKEMCAAFDVYRNVSISKSKHLSHS